MVPFCGIAGMVLSLALAPLPEECVDNSGQTTDVCYDDSDAISLLQTRITEHPAKLSAEASHTRISEHPAKLSAEAAEAAKSLNEIDCVKYPVFCHEKLDCPNIGAIPERVALNGHANPQMWCYSYPHYVGLLQHCILGADLVAAAVDTFQEQKAQGLLNVDASYCFLAGHCNDTLVSTGSTVDHSEAFCDQKYGHEQWTSVPLAAASRVFAEQVDWEHGYDSRQSAEVIGKLACAMGSYHCDVVYCKQHFCKDPHYRGKFSRLLRENS